MGTGEGFISQEGNDKEFNAMKFTLLGGVENKASELVNNVKNYLTKEKMIALSILSRIVGIVMVLSAFPIGIIEVNAADSQEEVKPISSELRLDVQSNVPDVVKESSVPKIVIGESNYQKTKREEAEKNNSLSADREVIAREIERDQTTPVYDSDPGLETKRALVQEAASAHGVDWKILEAVWQVETGKRWNGSVSSYAGAQGPMQFMPGTWAAYGQDGNGDGVIDINNVYDALYGAANYLAANGASSGDNYNALFAYNHADWYVQKVLGVANSI